MTLEEAIDDLKSSIAVVSPEAVIRVLRVEDGATIRAYAPAEHETAIKEATRDKTISLFTNDGLDVQVIFYDMATDLPPDEASE
jgi:hypothetical protein